MKHYIIEPEVSGGLGEDTLLNRATHPPEVTKLHYKFDGWLGDVLVESFPCFILTLEAAKQLQKLSVTGAQFDDVRITKSIQFEEAYPSRALPEFRWLQVTGKAGFTDFGLAKDFRLVVSDRVLKVLKSLGLTNALIDDFCS